MKQVRLFLSVLILFVCHEGFSQNKQIDIVKKYVKYYNTGDIQGFDSLLTESCQSFSKNIILDKPEMIDIVKNLSKNEKIEIIEIISSQNTVKTKEVLKDDIINYLGLKPIVRKREYNFDHTNKIKSIFNLDVSFPENFEEKQDKFLNWASIRYPELYDDMTEKFKRGENIAEERRFLLTLLKEEGLGSLDNIQTEENNIEIDDQKTDITLDHNEIYPASSISFDDFRLAVLLKTKSQIDAMFGPACEVKMISGKKYWYYGAGICNETYSGPRIFYVDTGEDVQQVQIEFNNDGIAVSVNAI